MKKISWEDWLDHTERLWAEWLDYRKRLDEAPSDEEREKITKEFHIKYPPAEDPDDDTVMLAASLDVQYKIKPWI